MGIKHGAVSSNNKNGKRTGRYFPKWLIYSTGGLSVFFIISLFKVILPLIGMLFLLAYIWSQATKNKRFDEF